MSLPVLLASLDMTIFTLVIQTSTWPSWGALSTVLALGDTLSPLYQGTTVHIVEDPKPIDDFGVLPMVQDFQLRTNWIRHQLLRLEVDLLADQTESNCERRGKKRPGARYSRVYCHR